MEKPIQRAVQGGVFLLVLALGLWMRLENITAWRAAASEVFYQGQPALCSFDGYRYLNYARELMTGKYDPVDDTRKVPENMTRPSPPPPASLAVIGLHRGLGIDLDWAAALLPALLGVLLAIPVWGMGSMLMGRWPGLAAALLALLSPYYVGRSEFGRLDTDCLNVTLLCAVIWLTMLGVQSERSSRIASFILAGLCAVAAGFWWDILGVVATLIFVLPLLFGLGLVYGRSILQNRPALIMCVVAAILILIAGWLTGLLPQLLNRIDAFAGQLFNLAEAGQLRVSTTIAEQQAPTLSKAAHWTMGSVPLWTAAMVGLVWMLCRRAIFIGYAAPLLILGSLGFFTAQRFLIFAVPLLALGASFLLSALPTLTTHKGLGRSLGVCGLIWAAGTAMWINLSLVQWPILSTGFIQGLEAVKQHTPEDAVIWALWDHGHAINYYAERATVNDPAVHYGPKIKSVNAVFATDSESLAAGMIRFFMNHGDAGPRILIRELPDVNSAYQTLRDILLAGPLARDAKPPQDLHLKSIAGETAAETWNRIFFPKLERPVYLLLDDRLAATVPNWMPYGVWARSTAPDVIDTVFYRMYMQEAYSALDFTPVLKGAGYQLWRVNK